MPDINRAIKFESQRRDILERLLFILNFNGDHTFLLTDLDTNLELQSKILDLLPEIRKYYSVSGCKWIQPTSIRPYSGIIRYILRQHNLTLYSTEIAIPLEPLHEHKYKKVPKYKIV